MGPVLLPFSAFFIMISQSDQYLLKKTNPIKHNISKGKVKSKFYWVISLPPTGKKKEKLYFGGGSAGGLSNKITCSDMKDNGCVYNFPSCNF